MKAQSVPIPMTMKQKVEQGWERLEYTGGNPNTLTFRGTSGRRYRAGGDHYHRYVPVHPDDVKKMLGFSYFRKAANVTPKTVLEAEAQPRQSAAATVPIVAKPTRVPPRSVRAGVPLLNVVQMKVADVLKLELAISEWEQLLAQEQSQDRPRKTIVKHAERRIRVAQAAV